MAAHFMQMVAQNRGLIIDIVHYFRGLRRDSDLGRDLGRFLQKLLVFLRVLLIGGLEACVGMT